jgi:hypothetical protein
MMDNQNEDLIKKRLDVFFNSFAALFTKALKLQQSTKVD